jgi:hypothetical protein
MEHFDPTLYGIIFSSLIDPNRLNDLGIGQENTDFETALNELSFTTAFESHPLRDTDSANACLSALWLHHDFLDKSHQISQNIPSPSGSFWHGIMHRREGDYWNSKYWFRQVGNHPIFADLNTVVNKLLEQSGQEETIELLAKQSSWDPFLYVDLVQQHIGSATETEKVLKQIQRLEWWLLFDYCYKKSITKV